MLTLPALESWSGGEAEILKSKIDFVSVFIAADRSWHGQLISLSKQISDNRTAELLGMSAFTTHIFKAIISTFIDWEGLTRHRSSVVSQLLPKLDQSKEREICEHLAELWMLRPRANTFVEMRTALSKRLADIGVLRNQVRFSNQPISHSDNRFLFVDYREGMKSAADIHNQVSDRGSRRWSFLFDEMEVAPSFVQESLFSDLRGEVGALKINYKLALAPFNKNFRNTFDEQGQARKHDYSHVDLGYPRKENGYEFSRRLCNLMLQQAGVDSDVETMLGTSYFAFEDQNLDEAVAVGSKYSANRPLGKVFRELSMKDASFRAYLGKQNLDLNDISTLDEESLAKTLRKVRNVVVIREYFARPSRGDLKAESLHSRSRKTYTLYSGNPSMLALTEGNPRNLINLFSPLVARMKATNGIRKMSESVQAAEIEKSIRVMRSLLKAVPHKNRKYQGKGLLPFLDAIGNSLHERFLSPKFSDQPPLSFRVSGGISPDDLHAIGKALNLGALIYIPDLDSEDILSSVMGKRFRLNYLLAVHYKLPLSLDREISLSALLRDRSGNQQAQMDLPDEH